MTDQHEADAAEAQRIKRQMLRNLALSLAAAAAAPFVAEALGWDLMLGLAAVALVLAVLAVWRVVQAQRSASADYVTRLWLTHTVVWVYSAVALGVAGIVWLFVGGEGPAGWENWIILIYTIPMGIVSVALRNRIAHVKEMER